MMGLPAEEVGIARVIARALAARVAEGFWVRFAPDSPVEGAGFEPSVPLAKELLFLERKCRKRRGSRRQIVGLPIVLGRSSACPAQIRLPSRCEATRRGLRPAVSRRPIDL